MSLELLTRSGLCWAACLLSFSTSFNLVLKDTKQRTPRSWCVAFRRDMYKDNGKGVLSWLSHRDIALTSNVAKLYELVLLWWAEVSSLSPANAGCG